MNTRARVLEALSEVHDPELDEPITSLGFVTSCAVSPDGDVEILLRLPTPQCAPNFAYLMAADARNVLRRLPEVGRIDVRLEDHYTGEEINAASRAARVSQGRFRARPTTIIWTPCASCSSARRFSPARRGCARRCWRMARRLSRSPRAASQTSPTSPTRGGAWSCAGDWESTATRARQRSLHPAASRWRPVN